MPMGQLEKLKGIAARMRSGLEESGKLADSTEQTLDSFEKNLAAMRTFHAQVKQHDSDLQNIIKGIGNFDPGLTPPEPPQTDINGVTLNPNAARK